MLDCDWTLPAAVTLFASRLLIRAVEDDNETDVDADAGVFAAPADSVGICFTVDDDTATIPAAVAVDFGIFTFVGSCLTTSFVSTLTDPC